MNKLNIMLVKNLKKKEDLTFVLAWVSMLIQLIVKVCGLEVMNQEKQRTRLENRISSCKRKQKRH